VARDQIRRHHGHARLDRDDVRLLTCARLDREVFDDSRPVVWLPVQSAYVDGEMCARPDGFTSFAMNQATSDSSDAAAQVIGFK
jgi:hypothetical protein